MLPRSTRLPALGPTSGLPASAAPGQHQVRGRVSNFSTVRAPGSGGPTGTAALLQRAVVTDPCSGDPSVLRISGPVPRTPSLVAPVDPCPTTAKGQVVCADDTGCICPLSGHITDTGRAVTNDVCGQAGRLATALCWILALAALFVLVALMR